MAMAPTVNKDNNDLAGALGEFTKSLLITLETTRRLTKEVVESSAPHIVTLPPQLTGKARYLQKPRHILHIYLPGPIPSLNMELHQYLNLDRRVKASLRDWWYSRLQSVLAEECLKPHFSNPVVILVKCSGFLDLDNYGIKFIIDALRYLNVIIDDDAANLPGMMLMTEGEPQEHSHLEIMIIEADSMIQQLKDTWMKNTKYF